jgi:membrane protein
MVNKKIELYKNRIQKIFSFLSGDIAVYSGSMSFLSVFSFIPFMMLGVFAAVNISFFAEYFNSFRDFLYTNLFVDSAETIVYYLNVFLQNSSKLGFFGLIFAVYSVFVFVKQLDYCVHRLVGIESVSFGIKRFLKYFAVMGFAVLSFSLSAVLGTIEGFIGLHLIASFAASLQMWFALFLLFIVIPPVRQSPKKAALYSLLCAILLSVFKKLFIYYILFSGSYNTIYGSFAALFWFFVWLNLSWYIFFASVKLYLK